MQLHKCIPCIHTYIHINIHTYIHTYIHADECQLHQCALQPLECLRENWFDPASATPSRCSSFKWLIHPYARISATAVNGNGTNDTSDANQTFANDTNGTSDANQTFANGTNDTNATNGTVVNYIIPMVVSDGFFIRDSPCDGHAQWLVSCYICIHTYIHTYIHTCVCIYIHTCIHTYIFIRDSPRDGHAQWLVPCYICIHTYIHTYIHTHMCVYKHILATLGVCNW
jgi:hypothetical protein